MSREQKEFLRQKKKKILSLLKGFQFPAHVSTSYTSFTYTKKNRDSKLITRETENRNFKIQNVQNSYLESVL